MPVDGSRALRGRLRCRPEEWDTLKRAGDPPNLGCLRSRAEFDVVERSAPSVPFADRLGIEWMMPRSFRVNSGRRPLITTGRRRQSEHGAALVEMAVVLPLLLLVLLGIFEFGRYIAETNTVANASREAARYAIATGPGSSGVPRYADCDGMRTSARQFGVLGGPEDGDITLEYEDDSGSVFLACSGSSVVPGDIENGDRIVATVSRPFQVIAPIIGPFLDGLVIQSTTKRTIVKEF